MEGIAHYPRANAVASERRKHLIRSFGSFSVIEENIIAPTPRKVIGCSPKVGRREKRKGTEEGLFGEAGFEIQNILLQPREMNFAATEDHSLFQSTSRLPIAQVLNLNEEDGTSLHPKMVTSLRSSNPITMNSPFHGEERLNGEMHQPTTTRIYQATSRSRNHHHNIGHVVPLQSCAITSRKELNLRGRSASWPGVPTSPISKKTEKSS